MTDTMRKENEKILKAFEGLRVADIRDGMDWCGYMHYGTVSSKIMPLFPTMKIGIAHTYRFLPYQGPTPAFTGEAYTKWAYDEYYTKICNLGTLLETVEKGDFLCLDQSGIDVGLIGSNSGLHGIKNGAVGWLSNGGVRDTDELILEKVPFWGTMHSQPMVQGRLTWNPEDENIQIAIGGVVIHSGDVVAADSDGAVVVPRKIALDVARYAKQEYVNDMKTLNNMYEDMSLEIDRSVLD